MPESKVNILIVDDDPVNLQALAAVLEPLGENILTAASGQEALRLLIDTDFAAILLDVQIPGMSGLEIATLIRQNKRFAHTPILFITAYDTTDPQVMQGYEIGAVEYLFKPVVPAILRYKLSVFADLFRAVRAQAERAAALQRSNELLKEFAFVAAHDLRAPLRAVSSHLQLLTLRLDGLLDADAQTSIEFAVDGCGRMKQMLDELLDYAQISTDTSRLRLTDSNEAVSTALLNLSEQLTSSGAQVTTSALPLVHADGNQLTRLFQNLIANAIKFRSGSPPTVQIQAEPSTDCWTFSVTDNGIGIAPERTEEIFQPFRRLHSQRRYAGTGMGLAICKRIVERCGGQIWVESAPGQGSAFTFTLPRSQ